MSVTENKRCQHWVNPCNLGSLRCLDITVEGRWQKNTQIKPPAPEQRELRPMRLLIRAKVTQQLDSKLSPVRASGARASCSSTIPMSSGWSLAKATSSGPQPPRGKSNTTGQLKVSVFSFGLRWINYLKLYHWTVKWEIREFFPTYEWATLKNSSRLLNTNNINHLLYENLA